MANRAAKFHSSRLCFMLAVSLSGFLQSAFLSAAIEDSAATSDDLERIEVFTRSFHFDGNQQKLHILVTGHYEDGTLCDVTHKANLSTSDERVVRLHDRVALPVADGEATIEVSEGDHKAEVSVKVSRQACDDPVSFQYGALAALSKQGCNSGACHGSPSGKGGFRLSLRAYDPELDKLTLIREDFGRRTNTLDPDASLILRKPLMQVSHGGGKRLKLGEPAYEVLKKWLSQGCRVDPADAPNCVRVEIHPRQRVLRFPETKQQIVAFAHFSDGSVRDVTDMVVYSSSDDGVATIDETGLVTGHEKGEAAILVRYLKHIETAHVTFLRDNSGFQWPEPPANNYIDELVFKKLEQLQINPSNLCKDDEFLRRVYLDVIGILPSLEEIQSFIANRDPNKRANLIDSLLDRPEFADFWALRWSDLLRISEEKIGQQAVPKYYQWVHSAIQNNMPYDEFAAELITATGSTYADPAANYFRAAENTDDCTETTAQIFFGIRIQCAKCHNHPFERWTQDNYYGIGAFFNRIQRKETGRDGERYIWVSRTGEMIQPRTGEHMKPWLPAEGTADVAAENDPRQALVEWLALPQNPFFAHAEVNRIWGYLFGRGIVEPADDFRASNPPANAELLDALAEDFISSDFDRKHILRTILNSRTYQLSSNTNESNQDDERYFSHARIRLLGAEQLLDAICHVTGVQETYQGLPEGAWAAQLRSPVSDNQFLKVFGQPARQTACQCERSHEANLSQALQMINGPVINGKLRDGNNRLRGWIGDGKSDAEIVTQLFLLAYCRPPEDSELATATNYIAMTNDRRQALEDICWGVLNTKEFLFQH